MSNMLKMADSLSKQLSVEALLEQGHQMDLALHTKQLIETFEQEHTPFSFYTENCHPRSACVGGGKAQLFDHTDMSPYELSPHK
ncbi:unnamed protein product [Sphagnum jensenii]|uniref:Uncharacterized protein n=1 Tax=Sphagnum jensenii TaxID=128206 RepID=A0ABP0XDH9_9BRYO